MNCHPLMRLAYPCPPLSVHFHPNYLVTNPATNPLIKPIQSHCLIPSCPGIPASLLDSIFRSLFCWGRYLPVAAALWQSSRLQPCSSPTPWSQLWLRLQSPSLRSWLRSLTFTGSPTLLPPSNFSYPPLVQSPTALLVTDEPGSQIEILYHSQGNPICAECYSPVLREMRQPAFGCIGFPHT